MIREARKSDVPAVAEMLLKLRAEVAPGAPVCRSSVERLVEGMIRSPWGFVWVAGVSSPYGAILGVFQPYAFAQRIEAQEVAWYMAPEKRGNGEAMQLLRKFESWAVENKASVIGLSHTGKSADALYKRLGYSRAEVKYMKVV